MVDVDDSVLMSQSRRSSPQRDSLLDNSDLSIVKDSCSLQMVPCGDYETPKKGGKKKGKQKYKVMYQLVPKVIKVPAGAAATGKL